MRVHVVVRVVSICVCQPPHSHSLAAFVGWMDRCSGPTFACGLRWHSVYCGRCLLETSGICHGALMIESFAIIVELTAFIPCVNVRMNRSKRQKRNSNKFFEPTVQHTKEKTTEISFYTWTVKQSSSNSSRGLSLYLSLGAYDYGGARVSVRVNVCACVLKQYVFLFSLSIKSTI